jgi:soluble lytic murein transglycosylase-like protein
MLLLEVAMRCVSLAVVAGATLLACGWSAPVEGERAVEPVAAPVPRPDPVAAAEREAERLQRSILAYVSERNPGASLRSFRHYPAVVLRESARTNIDHCLALAQAQVESNFKPDALGAAGEIGLYQVLPSTAALLEPLVGRLRHHRDLADPVISTRFAMAYLRDILARRRSLRDALIEYNGGPRAREPRYYRVVMAAYAEIVDRPDLACRGRQAPPRPPLQVAFH